MLTYSEGTRYFQTFETGKGVVAHISLFTSNYFVLFMNKPNRC